MSKIDKYILKTKIEVEIQTTQNKIEQLKEQSKPISPENSLGRISRMDAINNKSIIEALLRESEQKLTKLKVALIKIEEQGFGICIQCKNTIPEGRLMLMPHAAKCVNCA